MLTLLKYFYPSALQQSHGRRRHEDSVVQLLVSVNHLAVVALD